LKCMPPVLTNRMFSVVVEAAADLLPEPLPVRVLLLAGEEIVGQVGMALEAELDRGRGILRLAPGKPATIGLMLAKEGCTKVRVAVVAADTDALLAQSSEIPVNLAI